MTDGFTCECGWTWDDDQEQSYLNHKSMAHRGQIDTESYFERYQRIRNEIPTEYHDIYNELTGSGRSPVCVQAAICYVESSATMKQVRDAFDVTNPPIRQITNKMIDRGVITLEEVRENCADNGLQTFGEKRHKGEKSVNLHG